jgi:hypothetical protein
MKRALIALALVCCGKSASQQQPKKEGPEFTSGSGADKPNGGSMNKPGSGSQASFVKGPSLSSSDLVTWMDSQKRGKEARLLRLVIVLPKGNMGFDISKAKIGSVEVYANDSALGIGLANRAEQKCADAATCAFQVEGYWRGKQMGGLQFDVMKAEYLPPDRVSSLAYAEVEGESGN